MKKGIKVLCLLVLAFSLSLTAQEKQNNFEISKSIDIYNSLFRELNLNYVDEINRRQIGRASCRERV